MTCSPPRCSVVPHLIERGGGTIVTLAAYSTRALKPRLPHDTAMKSALVSVIKNMAKAYGPQGIRVYCGCPGMIETRLMHELIDPAEAMAKYGGTQDGALYRCTEDVWGMKLALERCGRPEEVGELVAFLLSDRATRPAPPSTSTAAPTSPDRSGRISPALISPVRPA